MSALILPQRFNQQPQHAAQINWGNPITRNLEFAWVASSPSVLPRGASGVTILNNTAVGRPSVQGLAGSVAGSTSYLSMNNNAIFLSNIWTSLSVVTFPAVEQAAISQVASSPGSGTNDRSLHINASGMLTAYIYDGADKFATDTVSIVAGLPYVLAASSGGSTIDAWKDGRNAASTASANGGFGYGGTNPIFVMGYGRGGNGGAGASLASNAVVALQLWWTRALTAAEQLSMAVNPWQVFLTPARRIWAEEFISGGGPDGSAGQMYVIAT